MGVLIAGEIRFDADLVVFDKDGTLLDFDAMWGDLLIAVVEALTARAQGDGGLAANLYAGLGYDPQRRWTDPYSPWAMGTSEQGLIILAATLYRFGQPWHIAEATVRAVWQEMSGPDTWPTLLRPTTDLRVLFSALHKAGIRVAVDTADDRASTEIALRLLGVEGLLDSIVCGDDDLPGKPAPERLLITCRRLGVSPSRTVMVGDTVFDLLMGRRAGAGLTIGVLTGASDHATLAPHADVVLPSLSELHISEVPISRLERGL